MRRWEERRPELARAGSVLALLVLLASLVLPGPGPAPGAEAAGLQLPWRQAGLSEREAAAHLLDRLAFGPRPGEVDRVVALGLEAWLAGQLAGDLPSPALEAELRGLRSLDLSAAEAAETYPPPGLVLRQAQAAGVIPQGLDPRSADEASRRELRAKVVAWAREQGYRPQRELLGELMAQKLYRAVSSENQLAEVLTDFWFNHFNVSLTDNQARVYLPAYERDAIRPHVLGSFREMLGATARHPAMLLYLDNARSTAGEEAETTLGRRLERRRRGGRRGGMGPPGGRPPGAGGARRPERPRGLNENYARELLELHTLGVDGGYTQGDVVEVARAFTGWTVLPPTALRPGMEGRLRRALGAGVGFVRQGAFLFRADAHDAGAKEILGRPFPPGRGIEDGEEVLDLLAAHPSTARHLARKLAARFVADQPPPSLVDRLAARFLETGGDLGQVMVALVESPEFWDPGSRRGKIKSPFELAASALRALGADVAHPRGTVEWIGRMGQPLYAYQAPTGFPDRADFWVNTGALLNRMNFGLELAAGGVEGVRVDLRALNGGREPESRRDALETYASLLLPARDPGETVELLEPLVGDPGLARRVEEAAPEAAAPDPLAGEEMAMGMEPGADPAPEPRPAPRSGAVPAALEQVVGVILGSPEFQRR